MFLSVENIATLTSQKFISREAFAKDYPVYPKHGDVLMTRIGDIGTSNVVETDDKLAFYVSLALLKPFDVDSYYLDKSLQSPSAKEELYRRTLHIAFPKKINKNQIAEVMLPIPRSRQEQEQIGALFRDLDSLITLHQRMCSIFCFCAHGSRINFASILQGQLRILRYLRPMPKMRASPSALASGTTDIAVALSFSVLSPLARRPARQEELHH